MSKMIVENGVVLTGGMSPMVLADGAVVVDSDRVVDVGDSKTLKSRHVRAQSLDACGGLIMPGLVNLHHHFYSQMATGLDPGIEIRDFAQCLDRFWWRLDRAHDVDSVRVSAQMAAVDCIANGCTTVFDHHASPSCISGSLDLIADVLEEAGLSAVLCYEVTDRNGHPGAVEGLEENRRFFEDRKNHGRISTRKSFRNIYSR